ncbi:MAG: S8 family serine peptidase, partial [Candidatus Thermoplasmatota archaeon]|nr:S8 family serine peptidase [Candidatus Thermoplasmatota archaeon]
MIFVVRGNWVKTATVLLALLFLIPVMLPSTEALDIAIRAVKARDSKEYSPHTAWGLGYTGKGINIAIMDTGVDDGHPCLEYKFVAGWSMNFQAITDGSMNPDDGATDRHGTFVAGCAMSHGASDDRYKGSAPDAGLIDMKVADDTGVLSRNAIIPAVEWAIEKKDEFNIRILSISLGSGSDSNGSDSISEAFQRAYEAGLICVTSGGNEGPDNQGFRSPASDGIIMVAATDDMDTITRVDDVIADFSSLGPRRSD